MFCPSPERSITASFDKGALQNALRKKHIGWPRKGLADVSFCGRIKLLMNNPNRQEKYNVSVKNNQLILVLNSEILLPEDAPVRVTSAQLEELDYRKLYEAYSSKGRKTVTDPRVLFKVMAYGYQWWFSMCLPLSYTFTRPVVMIMKEAGCEGIFGKIFK